MKPILMNMVELKLFGRAWWNYFLLLEVVQKEKNFCNAVRNISGMVKLG